MALHLPGPSRAEQVAIAQTYAPTFVFHPDERYLPTSPLFPLALDEVPQGDVKTPAALEEWLGTVNARVARYDRLSRQEKLALATVHWRVYETHDADGRELIAEYWCYYPFNEFKFHGGFVPYAVRDDHDHDLERVFIVLERQIGSAPLSAGDDARAWARRAFTVRRIIASAHDGAIPANEYDVPASQEPALPIEILVEHGSHAMAADVNRDGLFTPEADSSTPQHGGFVWGIRDHGETWSAYRSSYMDRREPQTAIRLCAGVTAKLESVDESCSPYELASADDLQRWFEGLKLTRAERGRIIGHTATAVRLFGDANIEDLMVPSDGPDGGMLARMLQRGSDSERGVFAGIIPAVRDPAVVVGGRFALPTALPVIREVMAEASAIAPVGEKLRGDVSLLGFYRADAVLKLLGGVGWFSQDGGRVDGVAGFELRLGRLRVRPTLRLRTGDVDTRIVLVF